MALLLPPAAQPREGLVLHALKLGEAQLVEDLVDAGLCCHLGRTAEMGAELQGRGVIIQVPHPPLSHHPPLTGLHRYRRVWGPVLPPPSSVTCTSLRLDYY